MKEGGQKRLAPRPCAGQGPCRRSFTFPGALPGVDARKIQPPGRLDNIPGALRPQGPGGKEEK